VNGTVIEIQFVNTTKNQVVFRSPSIKLKSADRLNTLEIIAPLPPIMSFCNEAGTFSFDIVCEGEILGSHRLVIREMTEPT
jgi:hypothetical protein